jgi:hypothetical protein
MRGYDIIGDVHGMATLLEERLHSLDYRVDPDTGVYAHPERTAVFVGDLVDRGAEQLRTLQLVKAMVDAGSALIVMGNHEFNAIAYSIPVGSGKYLRPHNERNADQHREFLSQLTDAEKQYYLEWFWTLPLWLDLGGLRVVHACWHEPSMAVVIAELGGERFTTVKQMIAATDHTSALYEAVEILLKGPEITLVDRRLPRYLDSQNYPRGKARIRWWHENPTRFKELAELANFRTEAGDPYPDVEDFEATPLERSFSYHDSIPVFYGHYWRQDPPEHLMDWTAHTACVDFSAVRGGTLVAYRWSGEKQIELTHYVPHGADVVAQQSSD